MTFLFKSSALVAITLILSACGSSNNGPGTAGSPSIQVTGLGATTAATFSGTYVTGCLPESGGFTKTQVTFTSNPRTANVITDVSNMYQSSTCDDLIASASIAGTYKINGDGTAMLVKAQRAEMTLFDAAMVNQANQSNMCEINRWKESVTHSILDTSCGANLRKESKSYINVINADLSVIEFIDCENDSLSGKCTRTRFMLKK